MKIKALLQLISFRDLRNAALGALVVVGGLALALATIWAQRTGNNQLAGYAAAASLVFVLVVLVFVVPPLARSATSEVSQLNLPFELTIGGALIVGLIVVVGFSAWSTGNNLLFLVLSMLISALVVGFAAGGACLKKLDVKMRFPEIIFAGEPTPIVVSLHNRKRVFPTFSVVVEVRGVDRERSVLLDELKRIVPERWALKLAKPPIIRYVLDYFVQVPRRDVVERRVERVFPRRGRFIIRDFELSTKFPFGFFRHRRRLSAQETEIVIFPHYQSIDEEMADLPLDAGSYAVQRRGLGQDLLALREYQPMDDLRHVDWRATARTNRLIVREFSAEDDKRVTVIFDTRLAGGEAGDARTLRERIDAEQKSAGAAPVSERFERGVGQVAALLGHFTEEQAEIRLIIDNEIGEFSIGKNHLYDNLRRLALSEPAFGGEKRLSSETLEEIFTGRENNYTFFVTTESESELPEEIVQRTRFLRY